MTSKPTSSSKRPPAPAAASSGLDIDARLPLLGGLSPAQFMKRHWQKQPLLVRQALPGVQPPIDRAGLAALAASDEVESRLVAQQPGDRWTLRQGPIPKLPAWSKPQWTLLVQGLDLHVDAAHDLLGRFRFVPEARLDDLMLSYASEGGGVGPHFDSYDVFLIQVSGRRHWRIGRLGVSTSGALREDVPLKVLADFEPEQDFVLEPGDMLYLPPGWAHDGVAEGECMTCSIGFRAAGRDELAREVMQRSLDAADADECGPLYRDPDQTATATPAREPIGGERLQSLGHARLLADRDALACALGEVLSEPKRGVWFDARSAHGSERGARLDQRTRALYDDRHFYINGESFRAAGRDARLMHRLADARVLTAKEVAALSPAARALLGVWIEAGWVQGHGDEP